MTMEAVERYFKLKRRREKEMRVADRVVEKVKYLPKDVLIRIEMMHTELTHRRKFAHSLYLIQNIYKDTYEGIHGVFSNWDYCCDDSRGYMQFRYRKFHSEYDVAYFCERCPGNCCVYLMN